MACLPALTQRSQWAIFKHGLKVRHKVNADACNLEYHSCLEKTFTKENMHGKP